MTSKYRRRRLPSSDLEGWVLASALILSSERAAAATIVVNTTADDISACAVSGSGTCSFRDAILFANANPGLDTIVSGLPTHPFPIQPLSALPAITDPVNINAALELDGSLAGADADGLQILAGSSGIGGLSIYLFGRNAITISGAGGNAIFDCLLGLDRDNVVRPNAGAGVLISGSANNSVGLVGQIRTYIAGGRDGIRVEGAGADHNSLLGSIIGAYQPGFFPSSPGRGIVVLSGVGTVIYDNGVLGSLGPALTLGPGSAGADVFGNAFLNSGDGILVDGSTNNKIGGSNFLSTSNLIVQNRGDGIHLTNGANENLIIGNYVGLYGSPHSPAGNAGAGIRIENSSGTIIGAAAPAGNFIGNNGGPGVSVSGQGTRNTITRNSIFANQGVAIDLGDDGPTLNHSDPTSGPNNWQNHPVLIEAARNGSATVVVGTLDGLPARSFLLEFFANRTCSGDFSDEPVFLGSTVVSTDRFTGAASFAAEVQTPYGLGSVITATATDGDGNTSELSGCATVVAHSYSGRRRPHTIHVNPRGGGS